MAEIRVKATRRNGKLVKAHTRRRKAVRNVAMGLAGAGAIAGGGLLLKKKLGLKSTGTALARPIRMDGRAAAMGRTSKAGARQGRAAMVAMQRRLGTEKLKSIQKELESFDSINARVKNEEELLDAWKKLTPEAKQIGLSGIAASGGQKAARQFRQNLLAGYRQTDPAILDRGPAKQKAFDRLKAYRKHFQKGGDRAGQRMNKMQFNNLRDAARNAGGGKSAAEIRANIRRDLGFSGRPDLTLFRKFTTSEIKQIRSAKSKGERRGRKFRQQLTRKWRKA